MSDATLLDSGCSTTLNCTHHRKQSSSPNGYSTIHPLPEYFPPCRNGGFHPTEVSDDALHRKKLISKETQSGIETMPISSLKIKVWDI